MPDVVTASSVSVVAAPTTASRFSRLDSIDFLRGLVMVIMALDHTRDFFTNLPWDPEDLKRTWYALFFTRWITHYCAPLFFFLAGVGAFFYGMKRTPGELRKFLWTRGVWLVALEFTVVGTAWTFKFPWGFFGVIWCLGVSMILLAVIVRLKVAWIAGLSVLVILVHDLFDRLRLAPTSPWASVWGLLHVKGGIQVLGVPEFVLFPIVPWFAVMSAGYAFAALLQRAGRRVLIQRLGLVLTIAFVLLRITNLYGNPRTLPGGVTPGDFHFQPTIEKTIILFLDTEKYPPSLQFLLMTIGPSLLLLAFLDGKKLTGFWRAFVVFGRVPMFFYILHLYLIHALAVVVAIMMHQPYRWLLHGGFWFYDLPQGYGYDLTVVYVMWLIAVVPLYIPCAWFAQVKQKRSHWLLSYL